MKVYVVVGVYSGDEISTILSNYGVKSTLRRAKKELKLIKEETLRDCEENGINAEIIESDLGLRIIYDNDDEEIYNIEERVVDYE